MAKTPKTLGGSKDFFDLIQVERFGQDVLDLITQKLVINDLGAPILNGYYFSSRKCLSCNRAWNDIDITPVVKSDGRRTASPIK